MASVNFNHHRLENQRANSFPQERQALGKLEGYQSITVTSNTQQLDPDEVFARAVPHEVGHALVAYGLGVRVKHISIQIRSAEDGAVVAVIQFPDETELPRLTPEEKLKFCTVLAGGIAGELFQNKTIDPLNHNPSTGDNLLLSRFTDKPLTEFEPEASAIIDKNRRKFRQLCSRMKANYPSVRDQIPTSGTGEFIVVSGTELDELLSNLD